MALSALILAAGKGTRMKTAMPKVLHQVCGKSLVERSVNAVAGLAPELIGVVLGQGRELVEQELAGLEHKTEVIIQKEQRGTGDAVRAAEKFIESCSNKILILPGDLPLLRTRDLERLSGEHAVEFLSMDVSDASGYGRVLRDENGKVTSIREEKDCNIEEKKVTEVNSGIYVLERELLLRLLKGLTTDNAQGEFYLTDIVGNAASTGESVEAMVVENANFLLGANTIEQLTELEKMAREEIVRELMNSGVRFQDPQATYVDEGVTVGADSYIGAGTQLLGKTTLGKGVRIDANCYLQDAEVGDGVHLRSGCVLNEAKVAENCTLGPYAHLRSGTVLEADVRVGNFVETKKALFKRGAKANHLSYVGDAEVGKNANIGAGTITCNYDGKNKHKTVIGEGAFIGSNTSLVAPVKVGARAVSGAGSTITKDIPDNALGIGRARQTNIDDWSKNK